MFVWPHRYKPADVPVCPPLMVCLQTMRGQRKVLPPTPSQCQTGLSAARVASVHHYSWAGSWFCMPAGDQLRIPPVITLDSNSESHAPVWATKPLMVISVARLANLSYMALPFSLVVGFLFFRKSLIQISTSGRLLFFLFWW